MKLIDIENIKLFTARLFAGNTFDSFLLMEASFSTAATFTIDGHINADFVGEEDMKLPEYQEELLFWSRIRPFCFEIIKGKKIPRQFRVVLKCSAAQKKAFLQEKSPGMDPEQISGLFLNIHFREGKLYCTTGIAMQLFTMDKSAELLWDEYIASFLNQIH